MPIYNDMELEAILSEVIIVLERIADGGTEQAKATLRQVKQMAWEVERKQKINEQDLQVLAQAINLLPKNDVRLRDNLDDIIDYVRREQSP